jgi:hypothetical protein
MIQTYGQGRSTSISRRVDHHARALAPLVSALMNGLLASEIARDDRVHRLHLGKGAAGVNLYLDSGAKFAFRPHVDEYNRYDRIDILDAPKEGTVVTSVRDPGDVAAAVRVIEEGLKLERAPRSIDRGRTTGFWT